MNRSNFLLSFPQALDLSDLIEYISILWSPSVLIRFDTDWLWHPEKVDSLKMTMLIFSVDVCDLDDIILSGWDILGGENPELTEEKFQFALDLWYIYSGSQEWCLSKEKKTCHIFNCAYHIITLIIVNFPRNSLWKLVFSKMPSAIICILMPLH